MSQCWSVLFKASGLDIQTFTPKSHITNPMHVCVFVCVYNTHIISPLCDVHRQLFELPHTGDSLLFSVKLQNPRKRKRCEHLTIRFCLQILNPLK